MGESALPQAPRRQASLWHHPDFRKLWLGPTISAFGSAITGLALPLTAVAILETRTNRGLKADAQPVAEKLP